MSIDKESTGLPAVNVQRRTTKVNLWMVAAILFFFAIMTVTVIRLSRGTETPDAPEPKGNRSLPADKVRANVRSDS